MQVSKAGVIAAGALATVAAMGSSAAAMPAANQTRPDMKRAATTLDLGSDTARQTATKPQPLISIGTGSSIQAATWQACASTTVHGVGGTVPVGKPKLMMGNCNNSNTLLQQDSVPGVISILDDSSINAAPWQVCGSNAVAGVGATVAVNSPALLVGDCANGNTLIKGPAVPDGPPSLISVLSGSVVNAAAWQVCGSTAVMGVGVAVSSGSPTTVVGNCYNGGVAIAKREPAAALPILSNANLNILPLQVCEQNSLASLVGLSPALQSPALVTGECISPQGLEVLP